jgi:hypothetical protein
MEVKKSVLKVAKTAGLAIVAFLAGWGFQTGVSAVARDINYSTPVTDAEMVLNAVAWLAPFAAISLLFLKTRSRYIIPCGGAFFLGTWMWVFYPLGPDLRGRTRIPDIATMLAQAANTFGPRRLGILICVALAAALIGVYLWYRRYLARSKGRRLTAVFLLAVMALGAPFLWVRSETSGWFLADKIQSKTEVGFYALAKDGPSLKSYLKIYARDRDLLFPYIHVWSNMPGKQIFYYFLVGGGMGPTDVAILTVIMCSLAAAPLFFVARRFVSEEVACGAAVLYFFIPTIPLFLPASNTITPFLALTGLWLVLWCFEKQMPEAAFAVGVYLGLVFFWEPIPFALALLLIPWIYRAMRSQFANGILCLGTLAGGFGVTAVMFVILTGIPVTTLALDTFRLGVKFNEMFHRGYGPYVLENFRDFLVAVGSVTAILWSFGAGSSAREALKEPRHALRRIFGDTPSGSTFVFCFTVFMVVLALLGLSRGEVDRLWIFLTPLAVLCALWGAERLGLRNAVPVLGAWMFLEWLIRTADPLHHWLY